MPTDSWAHILYLLAALLLVASSLAVRRLPAGRMFRYGLIWVVIFGTAALAFSLFLDR